MKKILSFITVLTMAINLFGQTDTTKVAFVSYWSIGDSYDFKVTKTKRKWKEGKLTKDEKQEYVANFTVIDSTDTSYTINWSYENDLDSTYEIPPELLNRFAKYERVDIKYKTSEVGDLLEILNWKEVGEIMSSMFDDLVEVLAEDEKGKRALTKTMEPLRRMYSSKEGIERLVLKELQAFHFPMGLEYDITEPIFYDDELPNLLGGKPLKAKAKLSFEDVDFEESFCVIKKEMSLDQDDTKEMLKQVFKKMKLGGRKMKKALETAVLSIEDRNVYEYYYYPGIPHRIETVRETNFNMDEEKGRSLDKTVIELIYEE